MKQKDLSTDKSGEELGEQVKELGDLKKIRSSDGMLYSLSMKAVRHSKFLSSLQELHGNAANPILIPFKAANLNPVVEWLENHKDNEVFKQPARRGFKAKALILTNWEEAFLAELNTHPERLFTVLNVAEYLGVEYFMETAGYFIAHLLTGKSVEECRAYLNLVDDLNPEEKKHVDTMNIKHSPGPSFDDPI